MNFRNWMEVTIDPDSKEEYRWYERGNFLKKFAGQQVFVTFHDVYKFGLNPQNKYNTPTAIYSYPIDYVLNSWDEDTGVFNVPHAAEANYITLFKHFKNKLIIINSRGYTSGEMIEIQRDLQENAIKIIIDYLNEMWRTHAPNVKSNYDFTDIKYYSNPFNEYSYNNFKYQIESYLSRWMQDVKKIYKNNIPAESAKFVAVASNYNINKLNNKIKISFINDIKKYKFPYEDDIKPLWDDESEFYKDKINLILGGANTFVPQSAGVDNAAKLKSKDSFPWVMLLIKTGNNKNKFNSLCRKAGIAGFIDNGTGTIHENEPTQAVFFNINDLKIIPPSPIHNQFFNDKKENEKLTYSEKLRNSSKFYDKIKLYMKDLSILNEKELKDLNSLLKNVPQNKNFPDWHQFYDIIINLYKRNINFKHIYNSPIGKELIKNIKNINPKIHPELSLEIRKNQIIVYKKINEIIKELTDLTMQEIKSDDKKLNKIIKYSFENVFVHMNKDFDDVFKLGDASTLIRNFGITNLYIGYGQAENLSLNQKHELEDAIGNVIKKHFKEILNKKVKEYKNEILDK